MAQATAQCDSAVQLLSRRFPLLLGDVSRFVAANPASTTFAPQRPRLVRLDRPSGPLLINATAADALSELQQSADPVLHCFVAPWQFLHFLGQPDAADCIADDNWLPFLLMPLEHAQHTQQLIARIAPCDWPWELLERSHFPDEAQGATAIGLARQLVSLINVMCDDLKRALAGKYANWPAPAGVIAAGQRPLRILVVAFQRSFYQRHCARDIAQGLESAGIDARVCIGSSGPAGTHEVLTEVHQFAPDVVFLNGRPRSDFPQLPPELAILSWDQDYALCGQDHYARHLGPRDRLIVMVEEWAQHARDHGVPANRADYVNLGVNCNLYHPRSAAATSNEILFVGNYHPFSAYQKLINFQQLDDSSRSIMLHARDRLRQWVLSRQEHEPHVLPDCDDLLHRSMTELKLAWTGTPHHWRFLVYYFRYRIAHLLLRELYVSQLTEFNLVLHGNGWEHIPALAPFARPEIENGPALRDAIQRAAINIHLHTWTVHHPRLYDTAAAGGFLLVGRVPEQNPLQTVFDVGAELDSFGTIAELKSRIHHYLAHGQQRHEMARRAAARAARDHDMKLRMAQVARLLEQE